MKKGPAIQSTLPHHRHRRMGPETAQVNRDYRYAATGKTENQVFTFSSIRLFDSVWTQHPPTYLTLTVPADTG